MGKTFDKEHDPRDRKRRRNDWRAARKAARKVKGVARGDYAGKRVERAKSF